MSGGNGKILRLDLTGDNFNTNWVEFVSAGNNAPTCSITSPADGATFTAGDNVTINADASDSDGTVTKVEFYEGANKLGEDTSSPYSYTWNSVSQGSYSLTAKATDNDGATTTSSAVGITVNPAGGSVTLNPIADSQNWQGVPNECETDWGLFFSYYDPAQMKFDLSSVGGSVTSATLRLYYLSEAALTMEVYDAASDNWTECGSVTSSGGTLLDTAYTGAGSGWYEFDVTSFIATEAAGDGVASFWIASDNGTWYFFAPREHGSYPPELVIQW